MSKNVANALLMSHSTTLNGANGLNCREVFGSGLYSLLSITEILKYFVDNCNSLHTKNNIPKYH